MFCEALPEKSPLRTIAKYVKCVDKVDKGLKTAEVIKLVLSTDYTLIYDFVMAVNGHFSYREG